MKKLYLLVAFLIISFGMFSQTAEDDGYVIGFDKSDSVYMDFKVERTEFAEWHKIGTVLNELYGLDPKELSEATVICDRKFKVYEGWKNVSEIDLANPQSTIASGKDKYIVQVKYRKGGSEDFADQSSTTTGNVIIINVETVKDGVGEKMATICYPSSKYEYEVTGDLSAERIYNLPMHEYPIFVNVYGIPRGFDNAKNLHQLDVHWDALYMNKAMYEYFRAKGSTITSPEISMMLKAAYNTGRCFFRVGMYHRALQYFDFVSRNSAAEHFAMASDLRLAECLEKLNIDNSEVYDKMILAHQNNAKMDARGIDCAIKACIARGQIYAAQKNVEKAKEYYQKASTIDTAKRYAAQISECMESLNKMSN